jgi:ribosomal protein S18 acetylase RimI-like enzyme
VGRLPDIYDTVIRSATPADAVSIVRLFHRSLPPSLIDRSWLSCSGAELYLRGLCLPPSGGVAGVVVLTAEWNGDVVGAIQYSRAGGSMFLDYVAVADTVRGSGLGSALLRHLALDPHCRGSGIVLDVLSENRRAYDWYRRLGFVDDGYIAWAETPITRSIAGSEGVIRNWPQAATLLAHFGFAEFVAAFGDRVVRVGILGNGLYRVSGHEAAEDCELTTLLASIDNKRRLLTIGPPPVAPGSTIVAELARLRASADEVLARLGDA